MTKIIQFPNVIKSGDVIKTETTLKNENCFIELQNEKEIFGRDLTDIYNEPAFYNRTSRSLKKAWKILKDEFDAETKMRDAIRILEDNKVSIHSYCMMD